MRGRKPHPGGRPREIARPRRLNLYVATDFADEVEMLAAHLTRVRGERVSIGKAITLAVRESPQFKAMGREARKEAGR